MPSSLRGRIRHAGCVRTSPSQAQSEGSGNRLKAFLAGGIGTISCTDIVSGAYDEIFAGSPSCVEWTCRYDAKTIAVGVCAADGLVASVAGSLEAISLKEPLAFKSKSRIGDAAGRDDPASLVSVVRERFICSGQAIRVSRYVGRDLPGDVGPTSIACLTGVVRAGASTGLDGSQTFTVGTSVDSLVVKPI